MTVELQILNKIIDTKDFSLAAKNGLTEDHFVDYKEEFSFLKNHYEVYENVPDFYTVSTRFREFKRIDVLESDEYLITELNNLRLYDKFANMMNEGSDKGFEDVNEGIKYVWNELPNLILGLGVNGVDLVKDADLRFNEYNQRENFLEKSVIKTELDELDSIIYGWMPGEDLITILGRINEGKSWMISKFASAAWRQGKRVGMYSSEMSSHLVGYRADTALSEISNRALFSKDKEVLDIYKHHIEEMKKKENPFIVVTKKELNGKLTLSKMAALIEKYELDAFFIDQYSGMEDENFKRGDTRKDRYARIADKAMDMSIKYGIPIIGAVQANRESVKGKDDDAMPDLENISDADEIGALSTRVISIRNLKAGLKFKIIKNRYGKKGDQLLFHWDIDKSQFVFIPSGASHEKKKQENKERYKDKDAAF